MLSIFPALLTYELLSPLILRVVLGILFISLGYLELTKERERWQQVFQILKLKPEKIWAKVFGVVELMGGILLVLGLFTQLAALLFVIIGFAECYVEYRAPVVLKRNIVFYVLITAISLSLLFTGAGFLAFDLPL